MTKQIPLKITEELLHDKAVADGLMIILSTRKINKFAFEAHNIKRWRRNPVLACEEILSIQLTDFQAYVLQMTWNSNYNIWLASRNLGKSFLGAVYIILRALLYENGSIYIIGVTGATSKETFTKIEDLMLGRVNSIKSKSKVAYGEVVKPNASSNGFTHDPSGFKFTLFNGTKVQTLNSITDNVVGKRSTLNFVDEGAFVSEEMHVRTEPFIAQSSEFSTSTEEGFDPARMRRNVPNQIIIASSAGSTDCYMYKKYKEYAMRMFAGDSRYFCVDLPCEVGLKSTIKGDFKGGILQQSTIDQAMATNRDKAVKEYYNKWDSESSDQPFKMSVMSKNSIHKLPILYGDGKRKFIIAVDNARVKDNSIIAVAELCHSEERGYYVIMRNVINLIDYANKTGRPMTGFDQVEQLRKTIVDYNGNAKDFENIDSISVDVGSGGSGRMLVCDSLLLEFVGSDGKKHKGFIDMDDKVYEQYQKDYKFNHTQLYNVEPKKWRTIMFTELEEMISEGLIEWTEEYGNSGYVNIEKLEKDGTEILEQRHLSMEEEVALINIDLAKFELRNMMKYYNPERTSVTYKLPKEKEKSYFDDRAYCMALIGHRLAQIRAKDTKHVEKPKRNRAFCFA